MFVKYTIFCLLFVACVVKEGHGRPGGIAECYNQKCPENTVACERRSQISDDKKYLISEVACLALNDTPLKKFNVTENNPFGSSTYFQGYSYSGVYEFTPEDNSEVHISHGNAPAKEEDEDSEPKSEVEDLNS